MRFCRLILLTMALALMGCSSPGHNSGEGYSSDVRAVLRASKSWVASPQNQGLLKAATEQCQNAVIKYANTEPSKLRSYANLDQLKSTLETSQTAIRDGEDPTKMWSSAGLCPVESVKMAQSQLESDIFNEEKQRK